MMENLTGFSWDMQRFAFDINLENQPFTEESTSTWVYGERDDGSVNWFKLPNDSNYDIWDVIAVYTGDGGGSGNGTLLVMDGERVSGTTGEHISIQIFEGYDYVPEHEGEDYVDKTTRKGTPESVKLSKKATTFIKYHATDCFNNKPMRLQCFCC